MGLPRELRDQICTYIISTTNSLPDITKSTDELTASRVRYTTPSLRAGNLEVLHLPESTAPLLQINKQLRAETLSNMESLARKPLKYSLDLISLNQAIILPTWISVPVDATRVDTLDITVRISGAYDQAKLPQPSEYYLDFWDRDGIIFAMRCQLYAVLERFIRVGPGGETGSATTHRHVTVGCLRFDVQTTPNVVNKRFGVSLDLDHWLTDGAGEDVLYPEFLAGRINGMVGLLLTDVLHGWFSCGKILYEHVDEVVVCRDGVQLMSWDIAEFLRAAMWFPGHEGSKEQFEKYKEDTWRVREERGLKALDY